jgi:hypothetical protein
MKYLGHSQLTGRLYILPVSKKSPKIDVTDDVKEFMIANMGMSVFVPCLENDPEMCGGFTSNDGQSLCYVKEVKISNL